MLSTGVLGTFEVVNWPIHQKILPLATANKAVNVFI